HRDAAAVGRRGHRAHQGQLPDAHRVPDGLEGGRAHRARRQRCRAAPRPRRHDLHATRGEQADAGPRGLGLRRGGQGYLRVPAQAGHGRLRGSPAALRRWLGRRERQRGRARRPLLGLRAARHRPAPGIHLVPAAPYGPRLSQGRALHRHDGAGPDHRSRPGRQAARDPRGARLPGEGGTVVREVVSQMTWAVMPTTYDLTSLIPFVAVVLMGFAPSRHEPESSFLANQRWCYRDLVVVIGVITALGFLPVPRGSFTDGWPRWAIIPALIALLIMASVWAAVRWRQPRPWRALGFEPSTAPYNALWALRIALGLASAFAVLGLWARRASAPLQAWPQGRPSDFLAMYVIAAILGPIAEEMVF